MRTPRPLVTIALALAVVLTACAGDASGPAGDVTAGSDAPTVDAPAPDEASGSVTEATLEAMRNLDPDRAASAHDHGDGHDGHDESELSELAQSMRLSGVDPERIVIPAIGVDADVIELGMKSPTEMETPDDDFGQTGWFRGSPKPGRVGASVIAGHVDDTSGPAVFFRLSQLQVGDEIEVHGADGEVAVFAVTGQDQFPKDELPMDLIFASTGTANLNLITCGGDFDRDARSYTDNTVVYTERIDHLDA